MSSKVVVVGIAASVLAVGAGLLFLLTRPAVSEREKAAKAGNSGDAPNVDKETMIKIFERITNMMQVVVMNLAEHEQKVRQTAAERGKRFTDQEMQSYLMSQFRQAMAEVEQSVYMEHGTTEDEVRKATAFYENDPDFKKTLGKLKRLFKAVTGQPQADLPEVPSEVTMEKVLTVMAETMNGINEALESIHEELTGKGLSPESNEFKEQLQNMYLERVGNLRQEVHERHGISEEVLHAAVLKYQSVESFAQQLMMITQAHRARLEKVGFQA